MKLVKYCTSRLVPAIALTGVLISASGCFTAFAPKRDFCTGDPKDTSLPRCKPQAPQ
ncbi:hypothetical protein [Massilia aquatica]|uniref:hypothetical protein n=1 Tax=Massilia aquatica TaxID=2609000 RepID=UPI001421013D|nr:hypothetical protein [Massilia aquatica]